MAETETTTQKTKKKAPLSKAGGKKACSVDGCKRGYRAKGLCFFHYKKWRRGELEKKPGLGGPRYDTCGKEGCKKKVVQHGLCAEHFGAWKASRKNAKLGAAAASAPAEAPAAG